MHFRDQPRAARLRAEQGLGMIELLAAMTVMLVGILSLFGLFQAGILSLKRASNVTTAAVIADSQMEQFRAIKYEALGLANADVNAADATYKADAAYTPVNGASTTATAALTAAGTTLTVASGTGFPSPAPFRIRIDDEVLTVTTGGSGSTSWTVVRGQDGTLPTTHSAGAAVTVVQRVDVAKCGTAPCTNLVPTHTVTGGDGRTYRVDIYATYTGVRNQGGTQGRTVKLMTVVVRDNTSPYKVWARVSSTFDEATGL
jgi:Tfp pilus assembly protein PilV